MLYFLRFYLFIFREWGTEGEKCQYVVASPVPHIGDLARHPGMCPRLGIECMTLWFADQPSTH